MSTYNEKEKELREMLIKTIFKSLEDPDEVSTGTLDLVASLLVKRAIYYRLIMRSIFSRMRQLVLLMIDGLSLHNRKTNHPL